MKALNPETPPNMTVLDLRGDERSPSCQKNFKIVCYNCNEGCERYDKCRQEWWLELLLESNALRLLGEK